MVYIINLKGSVREAHMRSQLRKINFDETNEGICERCATVIK